MGEIARGRVEEYRSNSCLVENNNAYRMYILKRIEKIRIMCYNLNKFVHCNFRVVKAILNFEWE